MKKYLSYIVALIGLTFSLSSCHTSAPRLDYKALAKASVRMGIDINKEDNHKLYIASAEWIGVPYRAGGDNKRGTDCSGLVSQLYKQVYNIRLSRSTDEQLKESNKVSCRNLREGDLVFFTSRASKKEWPMWVSILKMGNSYMPAQVKELLSAVSTSNTTRNTGFAEDE